MRSIPVCFTVLFALLFITPAANAGESQSTWTNDFETNFSASFQVDGISFNYPKEFELSETTLGVFLETGAVSGQVSEGSNGRRTRDSAAELLVDKQGGDDLREFDIAGGKAYTARSMQGEQICQTYILVFEKTEQRPIYTQFRWRADNPVNYTEMLDQIIASAKEI